MKPVVLVEITLAPVTNKPPNFSDFINAPQFHHRCTCLLGVRSTLFHRVMQAETPSFPTVASMVTQGLDLRPRGGKRQCAGSRRRFPGQDRRRLLHFRSHSRDTGAASGLGVWEKGNQIRLTAGCPHQLALPSVARNPT